MPTLLSCHGRAASTPPPPPDTAARSILLRLRRGNRGSGGGGGLRPPAAGAVPPQGTPRPFPLEQEEGVSRRLRSAAGELSCHISISI